MIVAPEGVEYDDELKDWIERACRSMGACLSAESCGAMNEPNGTITFDDFQKLDIRVGRVIDVRPFPEGKYSTHVGGRLY